MGKEYQFISFMDYNKAFRNLKNIKNVNSNSKLDAYNVQFEKVKALRKQIMNSYQFSFDTFKIWYNANSEFLFGGVLTADEKQEILMLEQIYRVATKNDCRAGAMELSNLHKSLQDAGYTEFIESYIEDYSL